MKEDELYHKYILYLQQRLSEGKINKGNFSLSKISKSKFDSFKLKYETDELFQKYIIELYKSETRDQKLDDVFNDLD